MIEYDKTDISEIIDVNKKNSPKNVIFVIIGIFRQVTSLQWM